MSAWRVPTSFVVANAPRLLCLPGRSKSISVLANAPRLCVCRRIPVCFVLTNAPRLSWMGPNLFLCSLMHLVCSVCRRVPTSSCARQCTTSVVSPGGSKSVLVLASAPNLCVCQKDPSLFCAHQCTTSVLGGPKSVSVLANAPRL